jgi:transcriptional regulator with XRE-family HTH domain
MSDEADRLRPISLSRLVGGRVRRFRKVLKLSQAAFGERVKISDGYVSLIERGKNGIGLEILQSIADGLGVAPVCFFDDRIWGDIPDRQILSEAILFRLETEGSITAPRAASLREWARSTADRAPITREDWLDANRIPAPPTDDV